MIIGKYKIGIEELINYRAIGVTKGIDDDVYWGLYIAKWMITLKKLPTKKAVVMPEDLIKTNYGRKGQSARYFD